MILDVLTGISLGTFSLPALFLAFYIVSMISGFQDRSHLLFLHLKKPTIIPVNVINRIEHEKFL